MGRPWAFAYHAIMAHEKPLSRFAQCAPRRPPAGDPVRTGSMTQVVERATDTNLPDFLYSKSTNRGVASLIIQRRTNAAVEQEPDNATVGGLGGAPALEEARQVDLAAGQEERDSNVDATI